ncbi:MAG: radical SAM protein [Proteobacteria bacterium]|nr:radical SAM protein [Pseudomonadota bacterium]NIS71388.1 radical SAM protein [Pseudomonadota bacterium]
MKKSRFGKRLIIPIFIPHQGCPHRCVFCNQKMVTDQGWETPSLDEIQNRIVSFLRTSKGRHERREAAFYGGSFTALPRAAQMIFLGGVKPFIEDGRIDAIRVSTRPDALDRDRLDLLRNFSVETVEVGAQSMVDEVLRESERGHTSRDVVESVSLARSMGFEVGVQMMLGLPGEDMSLFLTSARRVIDLAPDFVRIYPLLVLRGSPLERLYKKGLYMPISLMEAVEWAKAALRLLEGANIRVIRMGLQATPRLETSRTILGGPYHPAFRSLVESSIFYDVARSLLEHSKTEKGGKVRFRIAPRDLSNLKGERQKNVADLKSIFGLESIEIVQDPGIPLGRLVLENSRGSFAISRDLAEGHRFA